MSDSFDKDIDDLLNLTDTDSSSSSNKGVFEAYEPFVLELHDLKKDERTTEAVTPEGRIKKKKKKRSQPAVEATSSSSSVFSDTVPNVTDVAGKEEFYDADESYHNLTEHNSINAIASAAKAQAHSEQGQDEKLPSEEKTESKRSSAIQQVASKMVKKPTV